MGANLKIPVKVSGLPKPSLTWSKDEQPVRSHGNLTIDLADKATTLTLKKVTREDDGLYTLVAQNEAGQASAEFDVEVIGKKIKMSAIYNKYCLCGPCLKKSFITLLQGIPIILLKYILKKGLISKCFNLIYEMCIILHQPTFLW